MPVRRRCRRTSANHMIPNLRDALRFIRRVLGSASPTNGDSSASRIRTASGRRVCQLSQLIRGFRARHHAGHAPDYAGAWPPATQNQRLRRTPRPQRAASHLPEASARPCPPGIERERPVHHPARRANPHRPVNLRSCTHPMRSQRQRHATPRPLVSTPPDHPPGRVSQRSKSPGATTPAHPPSPDHSPGSKQTALLATSSHLPDGRAPPRRPLRHAGTTIAITLRSAPGTRGQGLKPPLQ
jgi:hypothetical protein